MLRSAKRCGVPIPGSAEIWQRASTDEGGDELTEIFTAFELAKANLQRVLWGALAGEIGVRPSLWSEVHVFDCRQGVWAHPYDDRGMDVAGPNKALLKAVYSEFNEYIPE